MSENIQHAYDTGLKNASGEKNGRHILKDKEVLEIIDLCKTTNLNCSEIGKIYNISRQAISHIKNNRRHITKITHG